MSNMEKSLDIEMVQVIGDEEIDQELLELADDMETIDYEYELGERTQESYSEDEALSLTL